MSVTEQDLQQYEEGARLAVTVVDDDRVLPVARGKTFNCILVGVGYESKEGTPGVGDYLRLRATPDGPPPEGIREVNTYVFEDWLIEKIERRP